MTAFIKFTPLTGVTEDEPLCYLLEVDEAKILLDCGWHDDFKVSELEQIAKVAKQVDAVLLSHPDLLHLGAYPYAHVHLGLHAPVYATLPVQNMGLTCMRDAVASRQAIEPFDTFKVEDVDNAFERVTHLRFSQPLSLGGRCSGIVITAFPAGHTIGGTVWKLKKDTDEIIYAVDYNHKKERHLNGTLLHTNLDYLSRPSLLITDTLNASTPQIPRKQRDIALIDHLLSTLEAGGSVLLPVDASARVLELAYLLDQHWSFHRIRFPLLFVSNQANATMQYAKSMLEWMGDAITRAFSQNREHPFEFRQLKLCTSSADLQAYPGPKVVLATMNTMDAGCAYELFFSFCSNPADMVILTDRTHSRSMARRLYNEWYEGTAAAKNPLAAPASVDLDFSLNVEVKKKVALEGAELDEYLKAEQQRREAQAAEAASRLLDDDSDMSDDEGLRGARDAMDVAGDEQGLVYHGAFVFDIYVKDVQRSGGFFKQTQAFRMFPFTETRRSMDDYGEIIVPESFLKSEYDQEASKLAEANKVEESAQMEVDTVEPEEPEIPTKYVVQPMEIRVCCKVLYIDFEGRSDGESIRNIIPQMAPKKLILVHGSQGSTADFKAFCESNDSITNELYTPAAGECINVSAATNILQMKLTDPLVTSLAISDVHGYQIAFITGLIKAPEADASEMEVDSARPAYSVLDVQPVLDRKLHPPIVVGDVRLSEFKRLLAAEGLTAEFARGGVLVVNRKIVVRKNPAATGGHTDLVVQGPLSPLFFQVRNLLYDQHAIL